MGKEAALDTGANPEAVDCPLAQTKQHQGGQQVPPGDVLLQRGGCAQAVDGAGGTLPKGLAALQKNGRGHGWASIR